MKKKKHFITTILIIFLLLGILLQWNSSQTKLEDILEYITDFMNHQTADLIEITGKGSLVNSKNHLKDSKITGEDYKNDDLYYPYYTVITEKEKKIYKQIYANIMEYQTTFIPIIKIKRENLENAITAVYNDHPEIFWTDLDYSYKYLDNGEIVQVTIHFNETIKNIEEAKNKFETSANEIILIAENISSDYEKERYVHDLLISTIDYNNNAKLNQNAYSAIVNHSSVCAGYAKAFQYIMIQLKIPTYYIIGFAGESHAWNIVKLSDGYYNVDVTWDDMKTTSYHYFNRTDEIFSKTHTRKELSTALPSCDAYQFIGLKTTPVYKNPTYENNVPKVNQQEKSVEIYPKDEQIIEEIFPEEDQNKQDSEVKDDQRENIEEIEQPEIESDVFSKE